jgi:hypothetical protein
MVKPVFHWSVRVNATEVIKDMKLTRTWTQMIRNRYNPPYPIFPSTYLVIMTTESGNQKIDFRTALIFAVLFVAIFLVRSWYSTAPELGGDAARKWEVSRLIAETGDFSLLVSDRHHSARWGINIPLAAMIKINGFTVTSYLLVPLLMYAGIFLMMMSFGRHVLTSTSLFALGVFLFYEPMFFRASTNPQPFVFGVFYISAALWFMTQHIEKNKFHYLLASAIFAFLAYGAKESYLFFFPGLFLLLLVKTDIRRCLYFAALLGVFLLIETLVFNAVSDALTFGRVEYLKSGHHLISMNKKAVFGGYPILHFLTQRWIETTVFNQVITTVFSFYLGYLLISKKLFSLDSATLGIFLLTASYIAILTFVPLKIDPLLSIQPLSGKYLTTIMPFTVFCCIYALDQAVRKFDGTYSKRGAIGVLAITIGFLLYALIKESPFKYSFHATYPVKDAFLWKQGDYIDNLNNSLDDGLGICVKRWRMRKTILYWLDHYILLGKPDRQIMMSREKKNKILHLDKYELEELQGYVPPDELMKILAMPMCADKKNS